MCKNPNDEVKYMTRVQSWSSPRLIDQFPCLTQVNTYKQTCAHVHTLHFHMHTNILLACPPPSPSSSKFSYKHNIITYQQKGEQSLEIYCKNTAARSFINYIKFNTSATFEKESPPLYPSLPFNMWVLSELCTRKVSHQ